MDSNLQLCGIVTQVMGLNIGRNTTAHKKPCDSQIDDTLRAPPHGLGTALSLDIRRSYHRLTMRFLNKFGNFKSICHRIHLAGGRTNLNVSFLISL
jgi:hypothetical protein